MVVDSYTQYNLNGIGVSITNKVLRSVGFYLYYQLWNQYLLWIWWVQCDITNSNSSFGEFGLIADSVSPVQYLGITTTASGISSDRVQIKLGGVKGLEITDFVYDQVPWIFNCNNC